MKIEHKNNITILIADEGMSLIRKENDDNYVQEAWLSSNDSIDNWIEVETPIQEDDEFIRTP